jgi:Domain of Unknown Function with PDB structure (DUF3857)
MKKQVILTCLLSWAFFSVCVAQKEKLELKVKFGKISEEEIKMTSYAKDPDASAVVLFDKGFTSLGNFDAFEHHIRIKIFKKEALSKANHRIIYSRQNNQSVQSLKASCFNLENGKLVETKAESSNIFDETLDKYTNVKKVNVPGVKEGSIIDIKYTINNAGVRNWSFQDDIPTVWSEYETQIPDFYIVSQIGGGFTPYAVNENDRKSETYPGTSFTYMLNTKRWVQRDVPAIIPERYMSSVENYKTHLSFFLEEIRPPNAIIQRVLPTWNEASKQLMDDSDYGDFIDKKSAFKEELATLVTSTMTPMEKLQTIYEYVGKNFEVNDVDSKYILSSLKEIKTKKKVSASEKNFLMMNMAQTAGIKVAPVLIRTRDDGYVRTTLAVLSRYNKTICKVYMDKDTFYVDASGYPLPMKLLPFNDLVERGVEFLGKENHDFVTPVSKIINKTFNQAILALNTEGALSGDINMTQKGYDAFESKKKIKDDGEEKYLQAFLKDLLTDGKIETRKFEGQTNLSDESLKGNFKVKTNSFVNKTDDKMYVNPLLCFGDKDNPFKADERKFDVDYGAAKDEMYQFVLKIPEGFKVEEMPKPMRMQTSDGGIKYDYLISEKDNTITLNTKLMIKKTNYLPEQYAELKEFYAKMIAKTGEQIVLTKAAK